MSAFESVNSKAPEQFIPNCTAVIVAAGGSRRMGMDKLAWQLAGMPVLRRTVNIYLSSPSINSIIVVCPQERWSLLEGMTFTKPVTRVDGGAERPDSVHSALNSLDPAALFVAVHDGARPLVSLDDIQACIEAAVEHGAAALARRVTDTMKRGNIEDFCTESLDRENLWAMETPQVFETALLKKAYQNVGSNGLLVTDEVSAVQEIGAKVKFVEPRLPNLKITSPSDLALAEALAMLNP